MDIMKTQSHRVLRVDLREGRGLIRNGRGNSWWIGRSYTSKEITQGLLDGDHNEIEEKRKT